MKYFRPIALFPAFLTICSLPAMAQQLLASEELPNAPSATLQSAPQSSGFETRAVQPVHTQGTSTVHGIVTDAAGDIIPGATITLESPGRFAPITAVADSDGSFTFADLPPGRYRLMISGTNLEPYVSGEFPVKPGETFEVPKLALKVVSSTSVDVTASADQVAQEQVTMQEKQRVFGVVQNFYTSYIWDAAPMTSHQKYKLAFRTIADPTTFLIVAGIAGAEQYNGTYPGYGPGIEGYGKRYGAALADSVSGRIIGSAILPSLLHQDPRYYYQGTGSISSRTWHAVSSAFVARGDNGRNQPNYSHILGNLAAGGIANAYHPEASRGVGLTFQTLAITTGSSAIGNIFREFLLRHLEPSVPAFANGKR
jgi:Carboxypeptidase regulatory-like domain